MAERVLTVKILGDASSLQRALSQSSRGAKKAEADLSRTFRGVISGSGAFSGLGRSVAFASSAFLGGAGFAAAIKGGFDEMIKAQKATAQTEAVLKSTGGAANVTAGQVDRLAKSLLRQSGIDDEVIKGGENILLTFTNIRNELGRNNDVFTRATKLTLDMSVALKEDLKNASIQVGKALNDPVKGITALRRVGVSFTESQTALIKRLAESGNVLTAQKLILRELSREFVGSAKAAGSTFGGQLDKLRETLKNLSGEIAADLAPKILVVVQRFQKWLDNTRNQQKVLDTAKRVTQGFASVMKALSSAVQALNQVTGGTANTLKLLLGAFVAFKTVKIAGTFAEIASNIGLIGTRAAESEAKVRSLRTVLITTLGTTAALLAAIQLLRERQADQQAAELNRTRGAFAFGPGSHPTVGETRKFGDSTATVVKIGNRFFLVPDRVIQGPRNLPSGRNLFQAIATGAAGGFSGQAITPHATALTGAQQRAISLAGDPNISALRAQAAFDKRALANLEKRRRAGTVSAKAYTDAYVKLTDDLSSQESAIQSILDKQASDAKARSDAVARAAAKAKRARDAAAKKEQAALAQIAKDQLTALFQRAEDASGVLKGLLATGTRVGLSSADKTRLAKGIGAEGGRANFNLPISLQLEQARAEALGKPLTSILEREKKAAERALKSGKLSAQAQIDAWNAIADINDQLKKKATVDQTKFRHVGTDRLLGGLGLTGDALRAARTRLAQLGPGGTIPNRGQAFALAGGTGGIVINGGIHLHGVQDIRKLENELLARQKSRPNKRRGS